MPLDDMVITTGHTVPVSRPPSPHTGLPVPVKP